MTYKPKPARLYSHYVKAGAHGETGDGKTLLGSTFPGPRAWLDPTHGCDHFVQLHAATCNASSGEACNGCGGDYAEHSLNIDTFVEAAEHFISEAHKGRIGTIIFDDVSMYQYQMTGTMAADPEQVTMDEWGPIKGTIIRLMLKACAAPCHLLVTSRASLVGVESDSAGKIKNVHKAARPKAWPEWIHPVDYQFFMHSKGSELAPDHIRYFAQVQKSRVRNIPNLREGAVIENPSFDVLFKDLLAREAGAPRPEYDDPDAATAAARSSRGNLNALANEAEYMALLAALTNAENMDALTVAWTNTTSLIKEGKFNTTQQQELRSAATAAKARLKGK